MKEEKDRFGGLIRSALRDEAAECRLPEDFAERVLRSARRPQGAGRGALRFPRWAKVAAAIAAIASFASFAAWIGAAVREAARGTDVAAAGDPKDAETAKIPNQGENTMIARKMAALVGAAMVSVAVPGQELTSESTFVFLRPETSSFWNTATNSTMTVPIDFPAGASRATLAVSGLGYSKEYGNIAMVDPNEGNNEFTFELPVPSSPEAENVYNLTLTFDNGVVRTAKLGLIQGLSPDSDGTTRCLAPPGSKVWEKVNGSAVLPIPYGMKTITINGIDTDTGLDGAQGWYALERVGPNKKVTLTGVADGVEYAASILGGGAGLMLICK